MRFDKFYNRSHNSEVRLYVAKVCVLEACGWIEEALDVFYYAHAQRLVRAQANYNQVKNRIKRISSFDYGRPIRSMIECMIGLHGVETFENSVNQRLFAPMNASLDALRDVRNKLAHTHVAGVQVQIDAPSLTISRFDSVLLGLRNCGVVFGRVAK